MKRSTFICGILTTALSFFLAAPAITHAAPEETSSEIFFDDFNEDSLDTSKWLVADKWWGGDNGGVVPENVSVSDGTLKLEGHGNFYKGDVSSHQSMTPGGIRTGAAIATRKYYSSGSYEVVAKVAPELGASSAMWTFEYEEYYPGSPEYEASGATGQYSTVNHEIDIEFPTNSSTHSEPSFKSGRFNTYIAENRHKSNFQDLPYAVDDGQFHTYRFDWHTGDTAQEARVDYYVDDNYICTNTEYVPSNASRFWIGIWFPYAMDSDHDGHYDTGWAGTPDFDTTVFEIDSVKITPYHESGDTVGKESFPDDGWAVDSFPELIEAENFNHIVNGDFSEGKTAWKLSGDADISDNVAILSSGATTDEISQQVNVKQKMTYTLSADIETDGTAVTIGVRKANGTCNTSKVITQSGHVEIPFVTNSKVTEMTAYIQVLRYQNGNPVKVDNVVLTSGKGSGSSETPTPTSTPEPTSAPEPTAAPEPTSTPEPTVPDTASNLIVNGDFSQGTIGWNTSGSTVISDEKASLASGSDTDTLSQKIAVTGGTQYTLTADVISNGAAITVGVRDYNGRYTHIEKTTDASGKITLSFTTASHIKQIEVFAEVLRYQNNSDPVILDNIVLTTGSSSETPLPSPTPVPTSTPGPTPAPVISSNLVVNGDFSQGSTGWNTSGSTVISDEKASLASGSDTDTLSQKITVTGGTQYTLTADVISNGATIAIGVRDYNGRYTHIEKTTDTSGKITLSFTTASHIKQIEVFAQVLRYQDNSDPVILDNVELTENTAVTESETLFDSPEEETFSAEDSFSDGSN